MHSPLASAALNTTICSPNASALTSTRFLRDTMAFVPVIGSPFAGAVIPGVSKCRIYRGTVCAYNAGNRTVLQGDSSYSLARSLGEKPFSSLDSPEATVTISEESYNLQLVIQAAYKQVFGNAYVMESERAELARAESQFLQRQLSVRELIRAFAKSSAYRKRFFDRSGPYRFIELNCKHLLGRAPRGQEEISFHVQKLMREGYEAEIDTYLDSEEYEQKFGSASVPRFIFEGEYPKNDDFNRMTTMRKFWDGCSTSTVSGSTAPGKAIPAQLTLGRTDAVKSFVGIKRGLPAGFRPEAERKPLAPVPVNALAPMKMRIKIAENLYQVFEVPAPVMKVTVPEWKKEKQAEGGKKWNGVWY